MAKEKVLTLIDLETSGSSYHSDRIMEVAFIQLFEGREVKRYETLVNPESHISPFILDLTGIRVKDLEQAPTFADIKDELFDLISGTIIAAHNVRFDYGFLKAEFKRHGIDFVEDTVCTVRLSRTLFPKYRRHSLDSLIERFSFVCDRRHRAMGDVLVLKQFLEMVDDQFEENLLGSAIKDLQRKVTLPPKLAMDDVKAIPSVPGVYIFYGDSDYPLYIGKSTDLQKRVLSHFSTSNTSSKEMRIFSQIQRIDYQVTAGELGALLLESQLIKEMKPLHNKMLRRSRSLHVLRAATTEEGYRAIEVLRPERFRLDEMGEVMGVFRTKKEVTDFLSDIVKEYELCPRILEVGKKRRKGACFYRQLGRCHGACEGLEEVDDYNARYKEAFASRRIIAWPFNGAILIEEAFADDPGSGEVFIFDNWSLLAKGRFQGESSDFERVEEVLFDKDVYKILKRYIRQRGVRVKQLKAVDLERFLEDQCF